MGEDNYKINMMGMVEDNYQVGFIQSLFIINIVIMGENTYQVN